MNACAICKVQFNDGVQCGSCKKVLDFGCASITEAGWRKLGVDRRAQWKCSTCKISPSPVVPVSEPVSLDIILTEIRDMKRQLSSLPALVDEIKSVKDELIELKSTCESYSQKFNDFSSRLTELETKAKNFDKLEAIINTLQVDLKKTKFEISTQAQRSRLNNLEIKGVPLRKDENLFSIVDTIGRKINYCVQKTQINYISRVPVRNSKEKTIIISFLNRYVKEDFVAAARSAKHISAVDIGFGGTPQRIYVNDHLSVESKKLLNTTKITAKDKNYEFVWVKHGKIHLRKNTTSKILIIRNDLDLNKIV